MVTLTPKQAAWVQVTYRHHALVETTARFNARYGTNYEPSSLKASFPFYGIRSGRPRYMSRVHNRAWLPEHIAWLRSARQDHPMAALVERFNAHFGLQRSREQVIAACNRYRIRSPRTGQFEPGQAPWNKGQKGIQVGGVATRFQPGKRPHNAVPVGSLTQHEGVWQIKVSESPGPGESRFGWMSLHRHLWEAAHGPQPSGTAIICIDGNYDNLALDNWELVTRAELVRLNQQGWRRLTDPALRRAMIAQCRLLNAAHQRARDMGLDLPTRRRLLPAVATLRPSAKEGVP